MYGIVNKAIQDLVTENFGADKWEKVRERSGVEVDFFLSNEPYEDDITYRLAGAVAEEMNLSLEDVLSTFGEWWVLRTSKEKYGGLMEAGGNNLKEFLVNLPVFHSRVMLIYPKLNPPRFQVSDSTDTSILVHYYSSRQGLQPFVKGLLQGLAKMYQTPATVELIQNRKNNEDADIFKVSW